MENIPITPKTTIYTLLEAYPQLEKVLIAASPQFKKLKNPLLRRTIAKIATLSQAAVIGGLKTEELVNKLRAEVGQGTGDSSETEEKTYNSAKPSWFDESLVVDSVDIRVMLDAGEQPIQKVLSSIKKLNNNEILKINAPFIPAPLIDKSASFGHKHWIDKKSDQEYRVYFFK
mgnify:CR=1 FL=1